MRMHRWSFPSSGAAEGIQPPFEARSLTIDNQSDVTAIVTDGAGNFYRALPGQPLRTAVAHPTVAFRAYLQSPPTRGQAVLYLSDQDDAGTGGAGAGGGGSNYYDRQAGIGALDYAAGGVAPAGVVVRAFYTVPAGRFALIDSIWLSVYRETAPGAGGAATIGVKYTPVGGVSLSLASAIVTPSATAAGSQAAATLAACGLLRAGDALELRTFDGSTGGTCNFQGAVKVTEFAA